MRIKTYALYGLPILFAGVGMSYGLSEVVGLNLDEAWAGNRAVQIQNGLVPLTGITPYTGPWHQYLVALVFSCLGGPSVEALRAVGVVANLMALGLYTFLLRRWLGTRVAFCASMMLATLPTYVLYGRLALEVFALGPLLAVATLLAWELARTGSASKGARIWGLVSGFCAGLLLWNHLLGATVVMAGAVTLALHHRTAIFHPATPCWLVGFCVTYMVPVAAFLADQQTDAALPPLMTTVVGRASYDIFHFLKILSYSPEVLAQLVDGDGIFNLQVGHDIWKSFPCVSGVVAVATAAAGLLSMRVGGPVRQVVTYCAALLTSTCCILPQSEDRYFVFFLLCIPVLLAVVSTHLPRRWAMSGVACLCLWQLTHGVRNGFLQPKLPRCGDQEVGERLQSSNPFVDKSALYSLLRLHSDVPIVVDRTIGWPLGFYDLEDNILDLRIQAVPVRDPAAWGRHAVFVDYACGTSYLGVAERPGMTLLTRVGDFTIWRSEL